jgi:hypothetical protein
MAPIHPSIRPLLCDELAAFIESQPTPPPFASASDWSPELRTRRGGGRPMGRDPVEGVERWEGSINWTADPAEATEGDWAVGPGFGRCDVGVFWPERLPADGSKCVHIGELRLRGDPCSLL